MTHQESNPAFHSMLRSIKLELCRSLKTSEVAINEVELDMRSENGISVSTLECRGTDSTILLWTQCALHGLTTQCAVHIVPSEDHSLIFQLNVKVCHQTTAANGIIYTMPS